MPDINKFKKWKLKHAIDTAKKIIESGEELQPLFLGYTNDSFLIIPGFFKNDEEKDVFLNQIKVIFAVFGIEFYISVNEAWVSTQEKSTVDNFIKPSLDPKRKEALVITCVSHNEKSLVMYDIKRKGKKKTLSKEPSSEGCGIVGRFTELLPPKDLVLPPEYREQAIDMLKKSGIHLNKVEKEVLN